jgi:hypothetical protein
MLVWVKEAESESFVDNLSFSFISSCQLTITWKAPHTLVMFVQKSVDILENKFISNIRPVYSVIPLVVIEKSAF